MERRYVGYDTAAGCGVFLLAGLAAVIVVAITSACDLPWWQRLLLAAPPTGLLLALAAIVDRRARGR